MGGQACPSGRSGSIAASQPVSSPGGPAPRWEGRGRAERAGGPPLLQPPFVCGFGCAPREERGRGGGGGGRGPCCGRSPGGAGPARRPRRLCVRPGAAPRWGRSERREGRRRRGSEEGGREGRHCALGEPSPARRGVRGRAAARGSAGARGRRGRAQPRGYNGLGLGASGDRGGARTPRAIAWLGSHGLCSNVRKTCVIFLVLLKIITAS